MESQTTWNKTEEKQFLTRLESRMNPDMVKGLGQHLNRAQLKGIARLNRDPYVLLYALGRTTVDLQRFIDEAEPDEKEDVTRKVFSGFCVQLHEYMKPPPDDDTPFDWYTDVAMQIWAAAN